MGAVMLQPILWALAAVLAYLVCLPMAARAVECPPEDDRSCWTSGRVAHACWAPSTGEVASYDVVIRPANGDPFTVSVAGTENSVSFDAPATEYTVQVIAHGGDGSALEGAESAPVRRLCDAGDSDCNGRLNAFDFNKWLGAWTGGCAPPVSVVPVPTP